MLTVVYWSISSKQKYQMNEIKKKKVLIIFPYEWIEYYPTYHNLRTCLSEQYDIQVLAIAPSYLKIRKKNIHDIEYFKIRGFIAKWAVYLQNNLAKLHIQFPIFEYFVALTFLVKALTKKSDVVIGADSIGLWVAQKLSRSPIYLSVDIDEDDRFFERVKNKKIAAAIIANEERCEKLQLPVSVKNFLVPNSSIFKNFDMNLSKRKGLVYCGTTIPQWGINYYLDYLNHYEQSRITIKGAVNEWFLDQVKQRYSHLLDSGRLILNTNYIENNQLSQFLSNYEIGLCLYDMDLIKPNKRFNQLTGSYGKLFSYIAAGVPVIATNLPGMKLVQQYNCGVLLDEHSPLAIHQAIQTIMKDYQSMVNGCISLAQAYSFDKKIKSFIDFLDQNHKTH